MDRQMNKARVVEQMLFCSIAWTKDWRTKYVVYWILLGKGYISKKISTSYIAAEIIRFPVHNDIDERTDKLDYIVASLLKTEYTI